MTIWSLIKSRRSINPYTDVKIGKLLHKLERIVSWPTLGLKISTKHCLLLYENLKRTISICKSGTRRMHVHGGRKTLPISNKITWKCKESTFVATITERAENSSFMRNYLLQYQSFNTNKFFSVKFEQLTRLIHWVPVAETLRDN